MKIEILDIKMRGSGREIDFKIIPDPEDDEAGYEYTVHLWDIGIRFTCYPTGWTLEKQMPLLKWFLSNYKLLFKGMNYTIDDV